MPLPGFEFQQSALLMLAIITSEFTVSVLLFIFYAYLLCYSSL